MAQNVIGFGASTMQGAGDSQGGFFGRAERLANDGRRWINLGVGGHSTPDMLKRAGLVTPHRPFDVVVLLGCNDMPRANDNWAVNRVALPQYEENLRTLLPAVRGERSLFVSSFPVSVEKTGVASEIFDAYMAAAMRIAGENGYDVWDLYRELRGKAEPYWAADGLHFNDSGHARIAAGVVERMGNV